MTDDARTSAAAGPMTAVGAGLFAAAGLGYINHAAHAGSWGDRAMYAAFGLYAVAGAYRLAGPRRAPSAQAPAAASVLVVVLSLLPLAARPEGRVFWSGGVWVAAAGGLLGFLSAIALGSSFGIAPAVRGVVSRGPYAAIRHPMAAAFVVIAAGYLLVHASALNAALLGAAGVLAVATALLEERLLMRDDRYRQYAAVVRWRFVPGLL